MALVNALLVRWAKGLTEVTRGASVATYGRHEGYLALGAAQSGEEAVRVAEAILDVYSNPIVTSTVEVEPTGIGDNPHVDFGLGDFVSVPDDAGGVTAARLRAITTGDDVDGKVSFVPEFRGLPAESEQTLNRWLKRMSNGALAGSTSSASPTTASRPPELSDHGDLPPFSIYRVAVSTSGRFYPLRAIRIAEFVASLQVAGSTTTTVVLQKNGIAVSGATISFPAGDTGPRGLNVAIDLGPSDYLTSAVTTAGTGAVGLTVQTKSV